MFTSPSNNSNITMILTFVSFWADITTHVKLYTSVSTFIYNTKHVLRVRNRKKKVCYICSQNISRKPYKRNHFFSLTRQNDLIKCSYQNFIYEWLEDVIFFIFQQYNWFIAWWWHIENRICTCLIFNVMFLKSLYFQMAIFIQ